MKRLFYGLAVILLCGQLSFAQDTEKKEPSAEAKENAQLQLDLLSAQKATLETRSELLQTKSELLQLQTAVWNNNRDKTQSDLNSLFGCKYDLDDRKCKQEPKKDNKE